MPTPTLRPAPCSDAAPPGDSDPSGEYPPPLPMCALALASFVPCANARTAASLLNAPCHSPRAPRFGDLDRALGLRLWLLPLRGDLLRLLGDLSAPRGVRERGVLALVALVRRADARGLPSRRAETAALATERRRELVVLPLGDPKPPVPALPRPLARACSRSIWARVVRTPLLTPLTLPVDRARLAADDDVR